MFFGLKWQAFLAFCASAISKESLLGVLNTLYGTGGSLVSSTFGAKVAGSASGISEILSANFTQAQGLAFIFAISFNMPCISALAATARETHSVKWTAKMGAFYTSGGINCILHCISYQVAYILNHPLCRQLLFCFPHSCIFTAFFKNSSYFPNEYRKMAQR